MSGSGAPQKPKDYPVGYGKPPLWSRFVKGQSGNSAGRPKRKAAPQANTTKMDKALRDRIIEENNRLVSVREGDRQIKITTAEALRQAERMAAFKGNPIAQRNALARLECAVADRAAEIEEDHAFWRDYCDKYQKLERSGQSISEEFPRPDDLIFKDNKFVTYVWTPKLAAENRQWIEVLLLQAEKDIRVLRAKMDISNDPKPLSLVFAIALNELLPQRYRFDNVRLILIMENCRTMNKRKLEYALKDAWKALGMPYRPATTFPAAEPHVDWLKKAFGRAVEHFKRRREIEARQGF